MHAVPQQRSTMFLTIVWTPAGPQKMRKNRKFGGVAPPPPAICVRRMDEMFCIG